MVPQPFIFPQTKDTTTTTEVESCGAGLFISCESNKKMKDPFVKVESSYLCVRVSDNFQHINDSYLVSLLMLCNVHILSISA